MPDIRDHRLGAALRRWRAKPVAQLARTAAAEIWTVDTAQGLRVLKVWPNGPGNERAGIDLMRRWARRSPAMVKTSVFCEVTNSFVMEKLEGPSLGDLARSGDLAEADRLLAETARQLSEHRPAILPELPPLGDFTEALRTVSFAEACPDTMRGRIREAAALLTDLLDTAEPAVCLHGDLHHDNVILTDRGPVAFDAKGIAGDVAYELANALRNPRGVDLNDRVALAARQTCFADALEVPLPRMADWAAVKCALSIVWRAKGLIGHDAEDALLSTLFALRVPGRQADPDHGPN